MKVNLTNKRSMTIPELLIVVTIGVTAIAAAFPMWYFTYKVWAVERIRSRIRTDLEMRLEEMKNDLRLSSTSTGEMSCYPTDQTLYTAISFPNAIADTNGFFTLNAENKIRWDRTIIYHSYANPATGKTELRKTVFEPRDNSVSADQRYAQLKAVVESGSCDNAPAYGDEEGKTTTLFTNLETLEITRSSQDFDGYSAALKRSDNIEFGSIFLAAGNHDIKFEAVGTNSPNGEDAFKMGIDAFSVSPSGNLKEAEYFLPPQTSSGDSAVKTYTALASGNNFLHYNADDAGDSVTLRFYYDSWLESLFHDSQRSNIILSGNDIYARLSMPDEGYKTSWLSGSQTGTSGSGLPAALADYTIRNIVSQGSIAETGALVKVKFSAQTDQPLVISKAYISARSGTTDDSQAGSTAQIFFSGLASVTIPAGGVFWSDWRQYNIEAGKDYFITFYTPAGSGYMMLWEPSSGTNSYVRETDYAASETWSGLGTGKAGIYAVEEIQVWSNQGVLTSAVYDTKMSDPLYDTITWGDYVPTGSSVIMDVRSSDSSDMSSATSWDSVSKGSSLTSVDGRRYIQFRATLTGPSAYTSDVSQFPYIDNVLIKWPGETSMCDISGYMMQGPDYGIARVSIDGQELIKGFMVRMSIKETFQNQDYEYALSTEIEPRNTGK